MRWQRIVFSVTVTEGLLTEVSEKRKGCGRKAIPPVVARIFFGRQHLTFDKGGKGVGDFRGIVRFWKGWTERGGLRDRLFLLV